MSLFENKLEQVTELISLPEIYFKINRLMDDPESEIDDFAKVISLDINMTAKLLNIVNSAYFGFSKEITSIATAISMLGIHQLQIMVLSISAVTAVSSRNFPTDIVEFKTFWRSSLLAGTLARLLAKQIKIRSNDRLFILGLLHEIGHLFLYSQFPDQARQTILLAKKENLNIIQAEQQLLGKHYGEIGVTLMQNWQLPESFMNSIRFQPTPLQTSENQEEIAILHIAHAYAHKQFIDTEMELEQLLDSSIWKATSLTPELVNETLDAALTESSAMEVALLQ